MIIILYSLGGMYYAWSVDQVVSTVLLITVVVGFTIICLKNSQETQLLVKKTYTFLGISHILADAYCGHAVRPSVRLSATFIAIICFKFLPCTLNFTGHEFFFNSIKLKMADLRPLLTLICRIYAKPCLIL